MKAADKSDQFNLNLNSSSNFVIEHFRRTDFHTVLCICIYIFVQNGVFIKINLQSAYSSNAFLIGSMFE